MRRGQVSIKAFWLRGYPHYRSSSALKRTVTALVFFFVLSSLLLVSASSVKSYQYRYGRIEGTVIDFAGLPVANATVYVLQNGRAPASITDAKGNFVLTNIEAGEHRIFAYKESDNYPNPVWSFYGEAYGHEGFPLIDVREDHPLQDVIVRLGPKSSRLLVKVTDARTSQPVSDAAISLNHEGKPKTLFSPGATSRSGELAILIPSGIPINLKITAIGYQTLIYRDKSSSKSTIQLKPGEDRTIQIDLTRIHRAGTK